MSQLLLSAYNCSLGNSVFLAFCDLYRKVAVKVKISLSSGVKYPSTIISVRQGIRQGAISLPPLSNYSAVMAHHVVKPSFLYLGQDLYLLIIVFFPF